MERQLKRLIRPNVFICLMMALLCICFSGCKNVTKDIEIDEPFRLLYDSPVTPVASESVSVDKRTLTLSALKMPLAVFSRILADKFGVGIVYSDKLQSSLVSGEFVNTDFDSVLAVVSRQLETDVVRVGNTYFMGSSRPEDRGVLVRRMIGYSPDELNKLVAPMLSTTGKNSALPNSVVVVTDHESVLRRVAEMLDYVDAVDLDCWIVQLYFVSLRKDAMLEAGLNTKGSGTVAWDIANSKLEVNDLKLEGLFNLSASSSFLDVFASPMFILKEGFPGTWKDGERVPIPRKTVSDYGTVTTTGFDYIDVGFLVASTVTESKRGGNLNLDITLSNIKSYVEYAPVTAESKYSISADLLQGKIYLLGELSMFKYRDLSQDVLTLGADRGKTSLQLWGKIYKLGAGGVIATPPALQDRLPAESNFCGELMDHLSIGSGRAEP